MITLNHCVPFWGSPTSGPRDYRVRQSRSALSEGHESFRDPSKRYKKCRDTVVDGVRWSMTVSSQVKSKWMGHGSYVHRKLFTNNSTWGIVEVTGKTPLNEEKTKILTYLNGTFCSTSLTNRNKRTINQIRDHFVNGVHKSMWKLVIERVVWNVKNVLVQGKWTRSTYESCYVPYIIYELIPKRKLLDVLYLLTFVLTIIFHWEGFGQDIMYRSGCQRSGRFG